MNEIDLNDLAIKTDSLPDSWKMLLIDPTTGLPAQNMTVARFLELLTGKIPEATSSTNGLLSKDNYKLLSSLKYKLRTTSDSQYILLMRTANYHYSQGCALIWAGTLSSALIGPICVVVKKNSVPVLTSLDSNMGLTRGYYYRVYNDMLELYVESHTNMSVSVTPLGNDDMFTYPMTVSSAPSGLTSLTVQSNRSIATSANALTNTIVEEVPISSDTPMTLQEDGQPAPTMQTIERYEYSVPKMAEAILTLQKELEELKGGLPGK